MHFPDHYPQILAEFAELICDRLCNHIPAAQAEAFALDIVEAVRANFSGCLIYIPKGEKFISRKRDAAIVRDFTGKNYQELAKRYKLTLATVYKIIDRNQQDAR